MAHPIKLLAKLTAKTLQMSSVGGAGGERQDNLVIAGAMAGMREPAYKLLVVAFIELGALETGINPYSTDVIGHLLSIADDTAIRPPNKTNIAKAAFFAFLLPRLCAGCNGTGKVVGGAECDRCGGTGVATRSRAELAKLSGLHHSSWGQGHDRLFSMYTGELTSLCGEGIRHIERQLSDIEAAA